MVGRPGGENQDGERVQQFSLGGKAERRVVDQVLQLDLGSLDLAT